MARVPIASKAGRLQQNCCCYDLNAITEYRDTTHKEMGTLSKMIGSSILYEYLTPAYHNAKYSAHPNIIACSLLEGTSVPRVCLSMAGSSTSTGSMHVSARIVSSKQQCAVGNCAQTHSSCHSPSCLVNSRACLPTLGLALSTLVVTLAEKAGSSARALHVTTTRVTTCLQQQSIRQKKEVTNLKTHSKHISHRIIYNTALILRMSCIIRS